MRTAASTGPTYLGDSKAAGGTAHADNRYLQDASNTLPACRSCPGPACSAAAAAAHSDAASGLHLGLFTLLGVLVSLGGVESVELLPEDCLSCRPDACMRCCCCRCCCIPLGAAKYALALLYAAGACRCLCIRAELHPDVLLAVLAAAAEVTAVAAACLADFREPTTAAAPLLLLAARPEVTPTIRGVKGSLSALEGADAGSCADLGLAVAALCPAANTALVVDILCWVLDGPAAAAPAAWCLSGLLRAPVPEAAVLSFDGELELAAAAVAAAAAKAAVAPALSFRRAELARLAAACSHCRIENAGVAGAGLDVAPTPAAVG